MRDKPIQQAGKTTPTKEEGRSTGQKKGGKKVGGETKGGKEKWGFQSKLLGGLGKW